MSGFEIAGTVAGTGVTVEFNAVDIALLGGAAILCLFAWRRGRAASRERDRR